MKHRIRVTDFIVYNFNDGYGKLIIEQLKQGNEDAFKYIYKQHYVLLCRFANQMLADAALAEEIVDDVIFYLWEHRDDIEIEYSIRAYLMRAVRNRCLNELNSLRRREELLVSSFFLPENMEFLDRVLSKMSILWVIYWSRNWKVN